MERLLAYMNLDETDAGGGDPPADAGAADAGKSDTQTDLTRADGEVVPAGLLPALRKAGIDPETAKMSEIVRFSNEGTVKFYKQSVEDRKARLDAEAKAREAAGKMTNASLQQLIADTALPETTRQQLQGALAQSQRLSAIEELIGIAVAEELLPEAAGVSILKGDPEQAKTVFGLVKQLLGKQAQEAAVQGASIGGDIKPPTGAADKNKPPESILGSILEERKNSPAYRFVNLMNPKPAEPAAQAQK